MDLKHAKQASIDFAKFLIAQYSYIQYWNTEWAWQYQLDKDFFGGSPRTTIQGVYYRMTTAEYEKETGNKLSGDAWNWDSWLTWDDIGAWVGDTVGGLFSDDAANMKDWFDYRQASGTWLDASDVEAPAISGSDAPWAKALAEDWNKAVGNRCGEVDDIQREIDFLAQTLTKAAESYMDTDLENATGMDLNVDGEVGLK